ncbi:ATP-binding protein [Halovivax limisalsi]|uniref:ATP-binding protein n=1 Tax=Halovivax limisalsi TaxID=1453760 RepID=UPI001FFC6346|nr:tetratricopeptide repeat protein [Halovivax limisalsi]
MDVALGDLVCLVLYERTASGEGDGPSNGRSTVALTPTDLASGVGIDPTDVPGRLDVFQTTMRLTDEGELTESIRTTDAGIERSVYALTEAGWERALACRRRLLEQSEAFDPSTVADDRPLWDVINATPETPLSSVLAGLSSEPVATSSGYVSGEVFVGRAVELETLVEALDSIDSRGGQTLFVTGEAGVGKSALVERLLDRAASDGVTVGRAACQRGNDAPYGPLRRAIERAFDSSVLDPLARATSEDLADAPLSTRQSALLGDVSTAVCDRSTDQPTLLFVDDLQWAGPATLALFERLADECGAWIYPLLLVGAYRPGAVAADAPLGEMRERLDASDRVASLAVAPFDRDDTARFVRRLVGDATVPAAFVDLVQEATGGNPLIVEEAVAGMLERDEIDPAQGRYPRSLEELDVPGGAEGAVERRIRALDETATDILETASIIGRTVDLETLASTVSIPEARLGAYLSVLVDARLLEWTGEPEADPIQFASGLVRETILAGLADDRRQALHERAAERLIAADAPPSAIAGQCEAAGQLARAIEYYERAADRARATYAGEAAVDAYERALRLADRLGEPDRAASIRLEIGRTRFVRGEPDRAESQYERALSLASDDAVACRAAHRLAELRIKAGSVERGLDVARDALELATDAVPPADRCRLHRVTGWGLVQRGDFDGARGAFEACLDVAEDAEDPTLYALATHDLGTLDGKTGLFERAERRLTDAVSSFERLDEAHYCAKSLTNLALVHRQSGDLEAAIDANERALSIQRDHGLRETLPDALLNQALLYRARGNLSQAVDEYESAIEVGADIGRTERVAKARVQLAQVHVHRGRLDLAAARCREAIATFEDLDGTDGLVVAYVTRARTNGYAGAVDRAGEDARRALSLARELGNDDRVAAARDVLGWVRRIDGDPETARDHHEAAVELAGDGANDVDVTRYRVELVADLREAGELDRALDLATETVTAAGATDEQLLEARARSRLGACCLALESFDRAERELEAAIGVQESCGATVDRVESLLDRCRVAAASGAVDDATDRLDAASGLVSEYGLGLFEGPARALRATLDE